MSADTGVSGAPILDVDLLAFERGGRASRAAVDGVRRSLVTGFVYTSHDVPARCWTTPGVMDTDLDRARQHIEDRPQVARMQHRKMPPASPSRGHAGGVVSGLDEALAMLTATTGAEQEP